jgi:hypothetical protein
MRPQKPDITWLRDSYFAEGWDFVLGDQSRSRAT